jgi:ABC-type nitrate/sulfonate/bicarbonate transport system substrate-binding protein
MLAAQACGPEQVRVTRPEPQPVTLRMNLTPSLSNAVVMIAKDEGEFAREGIAAEFVTMDFNSANMAVASGDLDVFFSPVRTGIFNMIARGATLRVVADKSHSAPGPCAAEAFTAPPDLRHHIETHGLRGQKIAVVSGGIIEYLADRFLAANNLTRDDVEIVQLPVGDYLSVAQKNVDAVRFQMEPLLSNAVSRGDALPVASTEELAPGAQLSFVVFGKRLLETDRALGVRFMRAYLRGIRRYREGKTERNVAIISRYTKLPAEVVRGACWEHVAADGAIDPAATIPFVQWARARGYVEGDLPVEQWWTPEFVNAAGGALR